MARPQAFDATTLAAAGLSLVAREGWPAVSVRSVADEVGVSAMALYRVAADAEGLRRLIADAGAAAVQPVAGERPLRTVLRDWAVAAHEHLGGHPGLAAYVIRHWTELPRWLDIVEALLARADADGLAGPEAVATVNAVFAYVLARAQLLGAVTAAPPRELAPLQAEPSRYPFLHRDRAEFTTAQTDRHFRFGLDALLSGLPLRTP